MAERFERLFQLQENQYIQGAPVLLAAGVLSKDTTTGSIIVQLKFKSVSRNRIKAAKVSLAAYDVSGKELRGVADYQYLELNIIEGQEFGHKKAIIMPNPVTRSFAIASLVIVFDDGSVWEGIPPFMVLPTPRRLYQELKNSKLEEQYRIETTSWSQYAPQEASGLWQCACSCWNSGSCCTGCKTSKEKVFSALDYSYLTDRMNCRMEQERLQHEAEALRQAQLAEEAKAKCELRQQQLKRRLKMIVPIALIISAIIGITIIAYTRRKEVTMEQMLGWYTDEDVVSYLGKDNDDNDNTFDTYDVKFMKEDFLLAIYYEDGIIDFWWLNYTYPGISGLPIEKALDYQAPEKEIIAVRNVFSEVIKSFSEMYGDPKVRSLPRVATEYTWIVYDHKIRVLDYIEVADSALLGAFDIEVYCIDVQTVCTHTDMKVESAEATCTKDGYDRKTCTICGYVEEAVYNAYEHKYSSETTKEPTCSTEGEKIFTCTECGHSYSESIPKIETEESTGKGITAVAPETPTQTAAPTTPTVTPTPEAPLQTSPPAPVEKPAEEDKIQEPTLNYDSYFLKTGEQLQLEVTDAISGAKVTDIKWSVIGGKDSVFVKDGVVSQSENWWTSCTIVAETKNGKRLTCNIIKDNTYSDLVKTDGSQYVYTRYPTILSLDNAISTPHFESEHELTLNSYCFVYQAETMEASDTYAKLYAQYLQKCGYTLVGQSGKNDGGQLYLLETPDRQYSITITTGPQPTYAVYGVQYYQYRYLVRITAL